MRRLVRLLEESDAGELTVEEDGVRITVRRRESGPSQAQPLFGAQPAATPAEPALRGRSAARTSCSSRARWSATSTARRRPDADPFVQEGDRVEVGQTLCILEAMKLFNEFKSDHAGTVRKVLVDDAQPVEFGQPLFELAPL